MPARPAARGARAPRPARARMSPGVAGHVPGVARPVGGPPPGGARGRFTPWLIRPASPTDSAGFAPASLASWRLPLPPYACVFYILLQGVCCGRGGGGACVGSVRGRAKGGAARLPAMRGDRRKWLSRKDIKKYELTRELDFTLRLKPLFFTYKTIYNIRFSFVKYPLCPCIYEADLNILFSTELGPGWPKKLGSEGGNAR